jgi:type II secretory pathway pseudopilin PulG
MNARLFSRRRPAGYTLVEVLAASGLIAAAIGAASALSMTMATQEEMARGQASAIRYGEAVARLWQLGVDPSAVLLTQTQPLQGLNTYSAMSWTITPGTPTDLGDDGGLTEGTVETATVSVTWRPYGSPADTSLSFDVLRPPAAHR